MKGKWGYLPFYLVFLLLHFYFSATWSVSVMVFFSYCYFIITRGKMLRLAHFLSFRSCTNTHSWYIVNWEHKRKKKKKLGNLISICCVLCAFRNDKNLELIKCLRNDMLLLVLLFFPLDLFSEVNDRKTLKRYVTLAREM